MQEAAQGDIELVLPPSTAVIRLARLVASGVAVQASLDVDAVDDVRIGVDELCSSLLEVVADSRLRLRFSPSADALEVVGSAVRGDGGEIDQARFELSRQILDVVVDEHGVELDGDLVTFWIRKRRRSTP